MRNIINLIIRLFFLLCVVAYVALYYFYFVNTGYLTRVKGVSQTEVTVNSTLAAVMAGTLVALTIQLFFRPKYITERLLPWKVIILSGFSTWVVVTVSALMYCSRQMAAFISASIIKGSVYPAATLVDAKAEKKGLKERTEIQKKADALGLILAISGIGLMVWGSYLAKKATMAVAVLGWFMTFLGCGAVLYSAAYGVRQYVLILFKSKLKEALARLSLPEEEERREELRLLAWLYSREQMVNAACFALATSVAWALGYLQEVRFNWRAALAGVPFGVLAFFSVMIMSVPLKPGRDETTMAFRTRVHKAGGTLPGLLATLTIALLSHKGIPHPLEWAGGAVVFAAIFSQRIWVKLSPHLGPRWDRAYSLMRDFKFIKQPVSASTTVAR